MFQIEHLIYLPLFMVRLQERKLRIEKINKKEIFDFFLKFLLLTFWWNDIIHQNWNSRQSAHHCQPSVFSLWRALHKWPSKNIKIKLCLLCGMSPTHWDAKIRAKVKKREYNSDSTVTCSFKSGNRNPPSIKHWFPSL